MCCGRGYDTTRVKRITKCECKFKWCCAVECKDCEEAVDIHTCKAPKRAEWLDQTWDTPTSSRSSGFCPRHSGIWSPSLAIFTPSLIPLLCCMALFELILWKHYNWNLHFSWAPCTLCPIWQMYLSFFFSPFFCCCWLCFELIRGRKGLGFKNNLCCNVLVYFFVSFWREKFVLWVLFCDKRCAAFKIIF